MESQNRENRLPHAPWVAIAGELVTAACFVLLALFVPLGYWVRWPQLLRSWHFAVSAAGALALAAVLLRRRPGALRAAIVLAAYIGLPNFMGMWQTFGEIDLYGGNRGVMFFWALLGFGMLGQVAALLSCLKRLVPLQSSVGCDRATQDAP